MVHEVAEALRRTGLEIWLDRDEVHPSDSIIGRIDEGLRKASYFVIFASHTYLLSNWTMAEYRAAAYAAITSDDRKVIVVRLDGVALPPLVSHLRLIEFTSADEVAAEIAKMVSQNALLGPLDGSDKTPDSTLAATEIPWDSISDQVLLVILDEIFAQLHVLRSATSPVRTISVTIDQTRHFELSVSTRLVSNEILMADLKTERDLYTIHSRYIASLTRRLKQGGLGIFEAGFEIELDQRQGQLVDTRNTIRTQLAALSPRIGFRTSL